MSKNYIDVSKIVNESPQTTLFNIVGRRGCGKTYGVKKFCLTNFIETGYKFLYIRRGKGELKPSLLQDLFDDIMHEFSEYFIEKYNISIPCITAWGGGFWLSDIDEKGKVTRYEKIGMYWSVYNANSIKGIPLNKEYNTIFFDEVITDRGYINGSNEPQLFDKIVKTMGRHSIKIFLCGNPDMNVEQCPYFYNLKIDYKKLIPNSIYYFNSHYGKHINEKNIVFIKCQGNENDNFIPLTNSGLFGVAEDIMSITGDVQSRNFKNVSREAIKKKLNIYIEIEVETAVILENGIHKKIYCYLGTYNNEWVICILGNHITHKGHSIYSVFDNVSFKVMKNNSVYRCDFSIFPKVQKTIDVLIKKNAIITDDDYNATTFFNIYNEKSTV